MGISVTAGIKQANWGCGWHLPLLGRGLSDRIRGVTRWKRQNRV